MESVRIGFLGFGEAGYAIASGLHEKEGVNNILVYDAMQDDLKFSEKLAEKRASVSAVKMSSEAELAGCADIIFVAIPSFCAFDCAKRAAEGIRPGVVYVDVSTATSAEKRAESEMFAAKGALFVDGAMMGALPLEKHQVHMMISGNGRGKNEGTDGLLSHEFGRPRPRAGRGHQHQVCSQHLHERNHGSDH